MDDDSESMRLRKSHLRVRPRPADERAAAKTLVRRERVKLGIAVAAAMVVIVTALNSWRSRPVLPDNPIDDRSTQEPERLLPLSDRAEEIDAGLLAEPASPGAVASERTAILVAEGDSQESRTRLESKGDATAVGLGSSAPVGVNKPAGKEKYYPEAKSREFTDSMVEYSKMKAIDWTQPVWTIESGQSFEGFCKSNNVLQLEFIHPVDGVEKREHMYLLCFEVEGAKALEYLMSGPFTGTADWERYEKGVESTLNYFLEYLHGKVVRVYQPSQ
jgi:hypothetical protein